MTRGIFTSIAFICLSGCGFSQKKGDGSEKLILAAGKGAASVEVADINKDGNLDITLANHERKFFTILLGNGKGQFIPASSSPVAVQVKPHPHGVVTADFNSDGNLDIATDSWAVDSIVILKGDGKGNFYNPVFYSTGKHPYQRLRTSDLNKDGNADIVTTNLDANTITVLLGDGKGKFTKNFFDAGIVPLPTRYYSDLNPLTGLTTAALIA